MDNLTILITGVAGFIGSHLAEKLLDRGHNVVGIDNLLVGSRENLKDIINHRKFIFLKRDITKTKSFKSSITFDVIIHLAAAKIPRYGNRIDTLFVNTKGTENMLNLAVQKKAKIIFTSTSDVYGKNNHIPFSESSDLVLGQPEVARWAYAASKIFDEHLIYAFSEKYGIPFVIIRLFGIFGPKQHRSWLGGPIPLFIDAIKNNKPVDLHGGGTQSRSFMYIDDAIEAIVKVTETDYATGQVINLGSTNETRIIDLAKNIAAILKKPLKKRTIIYQSFTGKSYEDVKRRVPDITKVKKILKWEPKTTIEEGLKKTIDWYINNPK